MSAVVKNKAGRHRITEGGNFRPDTTITSPPRKRLHRLEDYMQGIKSAENVDFTQRVRLYDIYNDTLLDPHLFSVVQKRKSGVLGRKIEFRRNGVADDRVNEQIFSRGSSASWKMRWMPSIGDSPWCSSTSTKKDG